MSKENENESIVINDRVLQYGVLHSDNGYQVYVYPGMTVAEIAFNVMVTIRLLESGGYLNDKNELIDLITKYYDDPQYAPLEGENNDLQS